MSTPATRPVPPRPATAPPEPNRGPAGPGDRDDPQRRVRHARFEQLAAENYDSLKAGVLSAVRAKLAGHSLKLDPLDLEGVYNQAWHGLYVKYVDGHERPENLGGWLALTAYRRAIDEVRSSHLKHRAAVGQEEHRQVSEGVYEIDLDARLADRETYRRWLAAARMRLSAREQQAVSLCVLHEYSRKEAADMLGVGVKRLDKIMTASNRKLGAVMGTVVSGEWCEQQRSMMKAFALGLLERDSERYRNALEHVRDCHGCAAYVRSVRGLSAITPMPILMLGAGAAGGGGIAGSVLGVFKGSGAAAGTAGATSAGAVGSSGVLGGIGATVGGKAAVCIAVVCLSGGGIVLRDAIDHHKPAPPSRESQTAPQKPVVSTASSASTAQRTSASSGSTSRGSSSATDRAPAAHAIAAQSAPDFGPDSGGNPSAPAQPAPSDGSPTFGP